MDIVDIANKNRDTEEARRIKAVRDQAEQIPAGAPGDCDLCGEWYSRLVDGACARCRDRYLLP